MDTMREGAARGVPGATNLVMQPKPAAKWQSGTHFCHCQDTSPCCHNADTMLHVLVRYDPLPSLILPHAITTAHVSPKAPQLGRGSRIICVGHSHSRSRHPDGPPRAVIPSPFV